ncbi:inositol phosphate phosphatase SopB [Castellaniella defragrans]|uniref:Phosphatidylinositol-4,5-bisphosphate 4-phosphatase n=1 Tax=Castellaniella defragrans TaxID=75697 RepID=A0A7W9TMM6_CASDE|nr:inositol phosphate phosphatase SopB [Castellaniella defragrans]KAB0607344.1 hypothetical protein F7Q88_13800 [Castellaniella defragrans]MBB6083530.1 phosphatidylinositol-4,5-bisphosphate 4-phosphatase [Castellaniella defragrans]
MAVGLENFRQVSSGVLEREIRQDPQGEGVRKSGQSRLAERIQGWLRPPDDRRVRHDERIQVKQAFLTLLEKTEGRDGARRALCACGLPRDWADNDRPLTNHQVGKILNKAQEFRQQVVRHNEALLGETLRGLEGTGLRDLRAAIAGAVRNDARYGSAKMSPVDIQALRTDAEAGLRELQARQCEERFPLLTGLIRSASDGSVLSGIELNPARLIGDLRQAYGQSPQYRDYVKSALDLIDRATELLGRQAWNQRDLARLAEDLKNLKEGLAGECENLSFGLYNIQHWTPLTASRAELEEIDARLEKNPDPVEMASLQARKGRLEAIVQEQSPWENLYKVLSHEISHQQNLLDAKIAYADEMRLIDPLTDRFLKHSSLLWAEAGRHLLDQLNRDVYQGNPKLADDQLEQFVQLRADWALLCHDRAQAYKDSENVEPRPLAAPSRSNKKTHPVVQDKRDTLNGLRARLKTIGIPRETLDAMFSKSGQSRGERLALSGIETWQPVKREMTVMRDGAMQTYTSEIVPAHFISPQLGVQSHHGSVGGVTSGVKDSGDHARNLKVSSLIGPDKRVMTTVVGHGVLDMWDIKDGDERQAANARGAREVLEVALASNARLRGALAAPDRPQDAPPPRLVHVSVNLISPDLVRDYIPSFIKPDYRERTYTQNQFRAFEANSGPGRELRLFDPQNRSLHGDVRVDVDAITFSFGINIVATSPLATLMRVWSNVHEHNTRNMIKLVGDLGQGGFGARGTRPGGFVGEAYDRLEAVANDPAAAPEQSAKAERLMAQLRGQTDLVRGMFTEETFRTGNGDTAKMGREILVLQGLAEQGLDLVGATDLAGTMSKGCKSDKDRGGVTDVELKSKLILRDLGGEMNPDERLEGDDQGVYYTVSARSGQLENQRWNTGLPGSKEAGHLEQRLPDAEVRQFLSGLAKFAKA